MKDGPGNLSCQEVLRELRKLGTEQNRKVYRRHGVTTEMCGVSFANLEKLRNRIKENHHLALQLWQTGNHHAPMLTTMVADPAKVDEVLLESWMKDLKNCVLTDALAKLVSRTSLAKSMREQWTRSDDGWVGRAGWRLLSSLALQNTDLPDSYFKPFLKLIECGIHNRKDRVRDAMNSALIARSEVACLLQVD